MKEPSKIKLAEIFNAVDEAGSFTSATVNLNLSQSAISRQIQSLEDDLITYEDEDGNEVEEKIEDYEIYKIYETILDMQHGADAIVNEVDDNEKFGGTD